MIERIEDQVQWRDVFGAVRSPDLSPRSTRFHGRRLDAFTLIEMLVVVAIIGVLVGIVIGVSSFSNRKAAVSRAMADLERIKTALEEFRIQNGRYFGPALGPITNISVSGLQMSVALSNYLRDIRLVDPWGQGYRYSNSAAMPFAYRVWSLGPDPTNSADDIESGIGYY